jgi:hypothetical protein
MSLAQVVHSISTDREFAAQWQQDPEAALAGKGLKLSREELQFLSAGLKRDGSTARKVRLGDVAFFSDSWR